MDYLASALDFLASVSGYLVSALLIGFAILIHEFGHLVAAWLTRIPIARFSVGIGPKLWGKQLGETDYWLSAIPLGGYVLPAVEDHDDFIKFPIWKRLLFAIGGPAANVLLSFVCLAVYFVWQDGFSIAAISVQPAEKIVAMIAAIITAIGGLFSGAGEVSGVVGIVAAGDKVIGDGLIGMLKFLNALSISLAVFNMLPMPPLDGGKIVMYLVEKIDRRLLRLHEHLTVVGILLILGLMIYATYGDVNRLLN